MSLYNMLFGVNKFASELLEILGLTDEDFGRFRDCYLCDEGIAVYTRCGGGNRDEYESMFIAMSAHPQYIRDADDDFDCTYATIYFRIPESAKPLVEFLKGLGAGGSPPPAEKFQAMFKTLQEGNPNDPEFKRVLAVGEKILGPVVAQLKEQEKKADG